jgi:hypothetical protein
MNKNILTQFELKKHLTYDAESGIFIRNISLCGKVRVGDICNYKSKEGYILIRVNNIQYKAHRLVWLYIHGYFPPDIIDHINGIRDDNRLVNIRLATRQQNNMNSNIQKNNKSGYKGVCWHKDSSKWIAQASVNNKSKYLGIYDTPEEASQVYIKFVKNIHKEFYKEISNGEE